MFLESFIARLEHVTVAFRNLQGFDQLDSHLLNIFERSVESECSQERIRRSRWISHLEQAISKQYFESAAKTGFHLRFE